VTACNPRTIASLNRSGLNIEGKEEGDDNPRYLVSSEESEHGIELYSKLVDDPINPRNNFAAVMTCDHADKNCPTIFGAEQVPSCICLKALPPFLSCLYSIQSKFPISLLAKI